MPVVFKGWKACSEKTKELKPGQLPKARHGYTMYHGTHKSNATVIISSGFKPSVGGTLGPGVYCSRDIKKASSYPVFCAPSDRVVLKLRVRVGKVKKIDSQCLHLQTTWHQHGYDTAWLPAAVTGLEEDCVWDPKRLTVVGIEHCIDSSAKSSLEKLIKQKADKEASGASGPAGNICNVCKMQSHEKHSLEKCWDCKAVICPFMQLHICSKK